MKIAFQIFDEPVDFTWVEKGRVDSLEWADHKPGGGDVKVVIFRGVTRKYFGVGGGSHFSQFSGVILAFSW